MARVMGKDVLVELMEAVEQLKASQQRQDNDIERIVTRLGLMAERSNETVSRMDSMTARMDALTARMNEMTARMNEMTAWMNETTAEMASLRGHFRELADDQLALRRDFVSLAQHGRQTQTGLQRLSDIIVKALGTTDERFDELEARVAKLEKKTG
ncbi:MAG: hypothetical protein AB1730_13855 [Myxococcota bacterium]